MFAFGSIRCCCGRALAAATLISLAFTASVSGAILVFEGVTFSPETAMYTYRYAIDNRTGTRLITEFGILVIQQQGTFIPGFIPEFLHQSPPGWAFHSSVGNIGVYGAFQEWQNDIGVAPGAYLGGFSFTTIYPPRISSGNNYFVFSPSLVNFLEVGAITAPELPPSSPIPILTLPIATFLILVLATVGFIVLRPKAPPNSPLQPDEALNAGPAPYAGLALIGLLLRSRCVSGILPLEGAAPVSARSVRRTEQPFHIHHMLTAARRITAAFGFAVICSASRTVAQNVGAATITEFPIAAGAYLGPITSGPDGRLWLGRSVATSIVALSTGGTVQEFPIPGGNDSVAGITTTSSGDIWFTLQNGRVGTITRGGTLSLFTLPSTAARSDVGGITHGPDNNLWIGQPSDNLITRMTAMGSFTQFPIRTNPAGPYDLTPGSQHLRADRRASLRDRTVISGSLKKVQAESEESRQPET